MQYKVVEYRSKRWTMERISSFLGVSKGFVCKWCRRAKDLIFERRRSLRTGEPTKRMRDGVWNILTSKSRRPKTIHRKRDKYRKIVIDTRNEHPYMGAQKMETFLHLGLSHQSIYRITVESGQLIPGKRKRKVWKAFQREHSNSLWQIDYKEFEHGIYMLSVKDDHSRMILAADIRNTMTTDDTLEIMERTTRMFGTPSQILSDHGTQWYSQRGGSNRFDDWCSSKGIKHIMGGIRKPTTQGKIERWHGTVLEEAKLPPEGSSPEEYSKAVQQFVEFHNNERPHWGIDRRLPIDVYLADLKNIDSFISYGVHEVPR